MPANLTDKTTAELIAILKDVNQQVLWASAVNELEIRLIPSDYEAVDYRGGIRPTHLPLNP